MTVHEKISARQFFILVLLFTIGSSVLIVPAGVVAEAKQDAWIAMILALGAGLFLSLFYYALSKLYIGETFARFTERTLGRGVGLPISVFFFGYTFTLSALVLRNLGDFIITAILPETPIQFLHISFMAIVIMAVRLGLEVIARAAEIFAPWALMFIVLIVLLLTPEMEFIKLQPVFGTGILSVLRGALPVLGSPYLELVVFLVILPYLNQTNRPGRAFFLGTLIGGILLFLVTFLCILVLGVDVTARQMYPSYTLAKIISVGDFLERLEVLLAGSIFFSLFFKLTLCFYASAAELAHILRIKDYRPLVLPLGMIVIIYSIIAYPNSTYFLTFVGRIWPYFAATFGLLLPLLLFTAAKLRGSRRK
jgi:spore germination protein KB